MSTATEGAFAPLAPEFTCQSAAHHIHCRPVAHWVRSPAKRVKAEGLHLTQLRRDSGVLEVQGHEYGGLKVLGVLALATVPVVILDLTREFKPSPDATAPIEAGWMDLKVTRWSPDDAPQAELYNQIIEACTARSGMHGFRGGEGVHTAWLMLWGKGSFHLALHAETPEDFAALRDDVTRLLVEHQRRYKIELKAELLSHDFAAESTVLKETVSRETVSREAVSRETVSHDAAFPQSPRPNTVALRWNANTRNWNAL